MYDPEKPGELVPVMDIHYGPVVAIDVLAPGTDSAVTVREDGEVQVWDLQTAKLQSAIPVCYQVVTPFIV